MEMFDGSSDHLYYKTQMPSSWIFGTNGLWWGTNGRADPGQSQSFFMNQCHLESPNSKPMLCSWINAHYNSDQVPTSSVFYQLILFYDNLLLLKSILACSPCVLILLQNLKMITQEFKLWYDLYMMNIDGNNFFWGLTRFPLTRCKQILVVV